MGILYKAFYIADIYFGLLKKNTISQSILTFLLASLLATVVSSAISMGGDGNTILQKADAVVTTSFPVTQANVCNEYDSGENFATCSNSVTTTVATPIQVPPAGSSNIVDILVAINQLNDCDEFDSGNNLADCANDDTWDIGQITQTNNPSTNPVGTNIVNIDGDDDQVNNCDESGSGNAGAVQCENIARTSIAGATQTNTATGPATAEFDQDNTISTFHRADLRNTCSESESGVHNADCLNEVDNIIGTLVQSNEATGTGTEFFDQENNFEASQTARAENDCDESGLGDNLVDCDVGAGQDAQNEIVSVTQENTATGLDSDDPSFIQVNDASSIIQSFDAENDCNESGDGSTTVSCDIDVENLIGPIDQRNDATGEGSADIAQNNDLNGIEGDPDIPSIEQVIVADNNCDEAGPGFNAATCDNDAFNEVQSITQDNLVTSADASTDITQDNRGIISQVIDTENDCDETSTGAGNNEANCDNDEVDNLIGILDQGNEATGDDNAFIDQDNNIGITQDLTALNNCDSTGTNTALCTNDDTEVTGAVNEITGISQDNDATLTGETSFADQQNNAAVDQDADLINTCGETGTGTSDVDCTIDASNFVDQITQANSATGQDADDITQQNQVVIDQNLAAVNDCDEQDSGNNDATCTSVALNDIGTIIQTNTGTGDGNDDIDQSNFVGITQNLQTTNDCDESGDGDNLKTCSIVADNTVGNIVQTNTEDDSENYLSINQDLTATNNCDDATSGNNEGSCTIDLSLVVPDIEQTGGETLTITQDEEITNTCEGSASCSASRTVTFVEPTTTLAAAAETTQEEEEENSSPTITRAALTSETETDAGNEQEQTNEEEDDGETEPLALTSLSTESESSVQEETTDNEGDEVNNDENTDENNNEEDVSEVSAKEDDGEEDNSGDEGDTTETSSASDEESSDEESSDEESSDEESSDEESSDEESSDEESSDEESSDDGGDDESSDDGGDEEEDEPEE